jgi:hypothetical protein
VAVVGLGGGEQVALDELGAGDLAVRDLDPGGAELEAEDLRVGELVGELRGEVTRPRADVQDPGAGARDRQRIDDQASAKALRGVQPGGLGVAAPVLVPVVERRVVWSRVRLV